MDGSQSAVGIVLSDGPLFDEMKNATVYVRTSGHNRVSLSFVFCKCRKSFRLVALPENRAPIPRREGSLRSLPSRISTNERVEGRQGRPEIICEDGMQTGKGTRRQNEKGNAAANICYRLRTTTFIFWFLSVAAPESFPRNENEPVSRVKEKVIAPLPPPHRDLRAEYIC